MTALTLVLVEVLGLVILWLAPWWSIGLLGAAVVGVGYSLVYPGFGVEVVRSASRKSWIGNGAVYGLS